MLHSRSLLPSALFAVALLSASAAGAQDSGSYVGVEGGLAIPRAATGGLSIADAAIAITGQSNVCLPGRPSCQGVPAEGIFGEAFPARLAKGSDIALIVGQDFGRVRLEAELGRKRLTLQDSDVSAAFLEYINAVLTRPSAPPAQGAPGLPALTSSDFGFGDEAVEARSAMVNVLADLPVGRALTLFAGAGAGRNRVMVRGGRDNAWAGQAMAGLRVNVTRSLQLGLKYRYFQTGNVNLVGEPGSYVGNSYVTYPGNIIVNNDPATASVAPASSGKFGTHSALASLTLRFGRRKP